MTAPPPRQKAFTLIELAIVLTVIGLIAGATFSAQKLVKSAQLRSVLGEVNRYKTAVNLFKSTYDALPGDMANATSYWSSALGNGNDNRRVEWQNEALYFWQQLSLSGLIKEQYTGAAAYGPGSTFPNSAYPSAGYYLHSADDDTALNILFSAFFPTTRLTLMFGKPGTPGDFYGISRYPILTTTDALALDQKSDDGRPFTGQTRIRIPDAPSCAQGAYSSATQNAAQVATNAYDAATSGILCNLIFAIW